jgi:hypothetical protein
VLRLGFGLSGGDDGGTPTTSPAIEGWGRQGIGSGGGTTLATGGEWGGAVRKAL